MGASCGCLSKKASNGGGGYSYNSNSNVITNKGGVQVGSNQNNKNNINNADDGGKTGPMVRGYLRGYGWFV